MEGKVVIVTGANTGLGFQTALLIAAKGAHVILGCRSKEKAEAAVATIKEKTKNPLVQFIPLDLASLQSISAFAQSFKSLHLPLHVLVNNAGIYLSPGNTSDGLEGQFGINHVGTHYLTMLLLDVLERSQPSRIVVVSSDMHRSVSTIDFEEKEFNHKKWNDEPGYCRSKLANILFVRELSKRVADKQIYVNSLSPGMVKTDGNRELQRRGGFKSLLIRSVVAMIAQDVTKGALTPVFVATDPSIEEKNIRGAYISSNREVIQPSRAASSDELAQKLWEFTEKLLKEKLGNPYPSEGGDRS